MLELKWTAHLAIEAQSRQLVLLARDMQIPAGLSIGLKGGQTDGRIQWFFEELCHLTLTLVRKSGEV